MDRSHGGRVERESEVEDRFVDTITASTAEYALPGIFAGGKQIVRTDAGRRPNGEQVFTFVFDDGTHMVVIGNFRIEFTQNGGDTDEGENIIDAEVVEEDEQKELTP